MRHKATKFLRLFQSAAAQGYDAAWTMVVDRKLLLRRKALTVVSFPKSGRTWLMVMLDQLNIIAKYSHDNSAHSRKPPLHFEAHTPAGPAYASRRIIHLMRDPRDTAVSGYFHVVKHDGRSYDAGLAAFIRDPRHGIEKIIRFNLAWLDKGPGTRGFLPLTYEQLKADTTGVLEHIAGFANVAVSRDRIAKAVADNSFARMQQKERSGYYAVRYRGKFVSGNDADADSYRVRKGKVRGYIDHFSEDDIRYCNELFERYRYFEATETALGRHWPAAAS
jgi:hypothetical protein